MLWVPFYWCNYNCGDTTIYFCVTVCELVEKKTILGIKCLSVTCGISARCDDKWQMKVWLLLVTQWHESITGIIKILRACVLVQRTHNNLHHKGTEDLKPPYYVVTDQILNLGLNGLPVCCCDIQAAGLHASMANNR